MKYNDSPLLSLRTREKGLIKLFASKGITLKFTGEYDPRFVEYDKKKFPEMYEESRKK